MPSSRLSRIPVKRMAEDSQSLEVFEVDADYSKTLRLQDSKNRPLSQGLELKEVFDLGPNMWYSMVSLAFGKYHHQSSYNSSNGVAEATSKI